MKKAGPDQTCALATVGEGDDIVEHKKDEEFWYEDGNIFLIAGDTRFRVFKGILADLSPVFRDMFSIPHPRVNTSSSKAAQLCPVVHVSDPPEELRYLLRVCFPKTGASRYLSPDPTYDEVSALIRLGHKYQIPQLVESSLDYLKRYYSDDLEVWAKAGRKKRPPKFRKSHAIGVVNLARLTGCTQLLPPALLSCCLLRSDAVVAGAAREGAPGESLSLDDIRLCYLARGKLAAAGVETALRVCQPLVSDTCSKTLRCVVLLIELVVKLPEQADQLCTGNPFRSYADRFGFLRGKLCGSCYAMLEERDREERRAMWKKLPELLGIDVDGWAADDKDASAAGAETSGSTA
ncbi:hypothetical protein K466DRAFT_501158 [Polyporus arcularius HHB13444]|uniref:BTB domain-containing protein n=1 Tax=Polyporus arcularius HHB13444 TaxID=1314778 RepID=A0A5C3NZL6_9APHY|nr:hypothetical protein K466DRAFT_501158 [Polyporus arcularius HHB13444]